MQQPRIFESDLKQVEYILPFNRNQYKARLQITAFGVALYRAMDSSVALTEKDETAAKKHFGNVSDRCEELRHKNKKLLDHIQVLDRLDVYCIGIEWMLRYSSGWN